MSGSYTPTIQNQINQYYDSQSIDDTTEEDDGQYQQTGQPLTSEQSQKADTLANNTNDTNIKHK